MVKNEYFTFSIRWINLILSINGRGKNRRIGGKYEDNLDVGKCDYNRWLATSVLSLCGNVDIASRTDAVNLHRFLARIITYSSAMTWTSFCIIALTKHIMHLNASMPECKYNVKATPSGATLAVSGTLKSEYEITQITPLHTIIITPSCQPWKACFEKFRFHFISCW